MSVVWGVEPTDTNPNIASQGHHQEVIDEISALSLGAATPMVMIEAGAVSTMVCWKHQKWWRKVVRFFVDDMFTAKWLPKQCQFAYFYIPISSGLHTVFLILWLWYPPSGWSPLYPCDLVLLYWFLSGNIFLIRDFLPDEMVNLWIFTLELTSARCQPHTSSLWPWSGAPRLPLYGT
jgi:hypothetical protein